MITENDIIKDELAEKIFEDIEQAIDRELQFIMEEYGLNIDMVNQIYDSWLLQKTFSTEEIQNIAEKTLQKTHPLLDTSDLNLNPPKDASILTGTYWCVEDVRHLFGDDVKYMTDEDIANELYGLSKWMTDGMTELGWEYINNNFQIKTKDDYDEEE
tara:strand:+ start:6312 stop:6782 length:471 start_codon:yes stop_codon:yes gene_type:complete